MSGSISGATNIDPTEDLPNAMFSHNVILTHHPYIYPSRRAHIPFPNTFSTSTQLQAKICPPIHYNARLNTLYSAPGGTWIESLHDF